MTTLETAFALLLFFLVPAVVWLAVDTWALRSDVNRLDKEVRFLDDLATRTAHNLISTEANLKLDILALEDAHDTTTDLDVPHIDNRPDTTHRQENHHA